MDPEPKKAGHRLLSFPNDCPVSNVLENIGVIPVKRDAKNILKTELRVFMLGSLRNRWIAESFSADRESTNNTRQLQYEVTYNSHRLGKGLGKYKV